MGFIKQQTKIREKQIKQKIAMEQRMREAKLQALPSQPVNLYDAEIEEIIEKQKTKMEEESDE